MQLYYPDKFIIEKTKVKIDNNYFSMSFPVMAIEHEAIGMRKTAVKGNFLEFLKTCYLKIPYRKSEEDTRNISHIILRQSPGLEDCFLSFFRFIECFDKKRHVGCGRNNYQVIMDNLKRHYSEIDMISDVEKYARQIVNLRNHYTHSRYFIKNQELLIKFGRNNSRNYIESGVDIKWIYERAAVLYKVCIDIIFKELLGYEEYEYEKNF